MSKFLKLIFLTFSGVAGVFYLFILPPLVATGRMDTSFTSIAFAAFMLFQVWMIAAEFAYESASAVFKFKRKRLFNFLDLHRHNETEAMNKSGFYVLMAAFLSYILMIYGFGVIYMLISTTSPDAFNIGNLGLIDGLYFSLVNSSTVGFGDITPKSATAKLIVMAQIIMSMAYVVMLFSSAVSYIRDEASNVTKP